MPIHGDEIHNALRDTHWPSECRLDGDGASSLLYTYLHLGSCFFYNRSRHTLQGNSESIKKLLADVI